MDDELISGEDEHMMDSTDLGDARRCPVHPHVKTSSARIWEVLEMRMFDGLCYICEGEMEDYLCNLARLWEYNRENPSRLYCGDSIWGPKAEVGLPRRTVACVPSEEDNIPF